MVLIAAILWGTAVGILVGLGSKNPDLGLAAGNFTMILTLLLMLIRDKLEEIRKEMKSN